MNKNKVRILILTSILIGLSFFTYDYLKKEAAEKNRVISKSRQESKLPEVKNEPTAKSTSTMIIVDGNVWKKYQNEKLGVEFMYPETDPTVHLYDFIGYSVNNLQNLIDDEKEGGMTGIYLYEIGKEGWDEIRKSKNRSEATWEALKLVHEGKIELAENCIRDKEAIVCYHQSVEIQGGLLRIDILFKNKIRITLASLLPFPERENDTEIYSSSRDREEKLEKKFNKILQDRYFKNKFTKEEQKAVDTVIKIRKSIKYTR